VLMKSVRLCHGLGFTPALREMQYYNITLDMLYHYS
jgi:hypothetical protein